MKKPLFATLALFGLVSATNVAAQSQTAPAEAAAPVSEAEIKRFANAIVLLKRVDDAGLGSAAEKQQAMVGAVQQAGLTPQRFQQIAGQLQNDSGLQDRLKAQFAAMAQQAG